MRKKKNVALYTWLRIWGDLITSVLYYAWCSCQCLGGAIPLSIDSNYLATLQSIRAPCQASCLNRKYLAWELKVDVEHGPCLWMSSTTARRIQWEKNQLLKKKSRIWKFQQVGDSVSSFRAPHCPPQRPTPQWKISKTVIKLIKATWKLKCHFGSLMPALNPMPTSCCKSVHSSWPKSR